MKPQETKDGVARTINEVIQQNVKEGYLDTNQISDGYHRFGELYEHRIQLWITVCKLFSQNPAGVIWEQVWRTQKHSDGSSWEGWFVLGAGALEGEQITYHLPMSKWEECSFADTLDKAPEFDGHTSADVLERLKNL